MVARLTVHLRQTIHVGKTNNDGSTTLPGKVNLKMQLTSGHVIAARGVLGISQVELASIVGVSEMTILRFERGERVPSVAILDKIQAELELRGIEFSNGDGIGVRLNNKKAAEFARRAVPARNEPDK